VQEKTAVAMTPKGWKDTDMKNSPERATTSNDIVIRDRQNKSNCFAAVVQHLPPIGLATASPLWYGC
jgi:hypothetical protein